MYPQRELIRLAAHKDALRRRIVHRRADCAAAATRVLRPVTWIDGGLAFWHRVSPLAGLAALPLGFLFKRSPAPRARLLGTLLRWGPLAVGAVRRLASGGLP